MVIDREGGAVWPARVGIDRRRPGRPLAAAEHVGADDEVPFGVDRQRRADDALPPTRRGMAAAGGSGQVAVASPRVADQHRVGPGGVQLAPRLVGDGDVGEPAAVVERERTVGGDGQEAAPAGVVARAPRAADRVRRRVDHRHLLSSSVGLAGVSRERKRSLPGSPGGPRPHLRRCGREAPWGFRPRLPDLDGPEADEVTRDARALTIATRAGSAGTRRAPEAPTRSPRLTRPRRVGSPPGWRAESHGKDPAPCATPASRRPRPTTTTTTTIPAPPSVVPRHLDRRALLRRAGIGGVAAARGCAVAARRDGRGGGPALRVGATRRGSPQRSPPRGGPSRPGGRALRQEALEPVGGVGAPGHRDPGRVGRGRVDAHQPGGSRPSASSWCTTPPAATSRRTQSRWCGTCTVPRRRPRLFADLGYNFVIDHRGRDLRGPVGEAVRLRRAPRRRGRRRPQRRRCPLPRDERRDLRHRPHRGLHQGQARRPPALGALIQLIAWKASVHQVDGLGGDDFISFSQARHRFPNIAGHRQTSA